jgi:hypothetical protein
MAAIKLRPPIAQFFLSEGIFGKFLNLISYGLSIIGHIGLFMLSRVRSQFVDGLLCLRGLKKATIKHANSRLVLLVDLLNHLSTVLSHGGS